MSGAPHSRQRFLDKDGFVERAWLSQFAKLDSVTTTVERHTVVLSAATTALDSLTTLANISSAGFIARNIAGQYHARTLDQGDGIAITNANGAAGNPIIALAELTDTTVGETPIKLLTRDTFGRIEGSQDATAADLPYVNTTSELVASDTQAAVDEVATGVPYFSDSEPDHTVHRNWIETVGFNQFLWYDDGDSGQWVQPVGGGGGGTASDAMVPYFIPSGENFVVPLYKQALFKRSITVEGSLVVQGTLIEAA